MALSPNGISLYVGYMEDAVALLRDKLAKAEAKVQRHEKSLESARTELSDLQIALRVFENLTGESSSGTQPGPSAAVAERQAEILRLLSVGRKQAHAPAELFASYELVGKESITIDTFRTTIWRMKDREFGDWLVRSDDGLYWKESGDVAVLGSARQAPQPPPQNPGWEAPEVQQGGCADDPDDDIPF